MKPTLFILAVVALPLWWVAAAILGTGCLGDIDVGEATATSGGATGGQGGDPAAGGGGTREEGCQVPTDGYCDATDDCECSACAEAAGCKEGGCMANGFCDLTFEDSCVCSDCDWEPMCLNPQGGGNCTNDGVCDRAVENCSCIDCRGEETCQDNHELCVGDAPNGTCSPGQESCSCSDCLGALACTCVNDSFCPATEPCICEDCWTDAFCTDPLNCTDDAMCASLIEGCQCIDCSSHPLCAGFP